MNRPRPHWLMMLAGTVLMLAGIFGVLKVRNSGDVNVGLFLFLVFIGVVGAFVFLAAVLWWPAALLSTLELRHWKMAGIAVVLLLIAAVIVGLPQLARSQRRAVAVNTKSDLLSAYADWESRGALTNEWRPRPNIHLCTNRYVIHGTVYQCALAADSWDYQGASNLLALTTEKTFLYVNPSGVIVVERMPPGY